MRSRLDLPPALHKEGFHRGADLSGFFAVMALRQNQLRGKPGRSGARHTVSGQESIGEESQLLRREPAGKFQRGRFVKRSGLVVMCAQKESSAAGELLPPSHAVKAWEVRGVGSWAATDRVSPGKPTQQGRIREPCG